MFWKNTRTIQSQNAERTQAVWGRIFAIPWIIGLFIFYAYPLASSIFFSFTNYNVISPHRWVGLRNYRMLFQDDNFWLGITNTLIYAAMAVPVGTITAVVLAIMLNTKIPGRGILRTIFYMPTLVPVIATSIIWQWLLNPQFGVMSYIINLLGFKSPPWLSDPVWSKPSLVLIAQWTIGNMVIVYLAGLQDISKDYYDAASIDGASTFKQFLHITLPLLTPVIFFNVTMNIINILQIFTLPYSLTVSTGKPPINSMLFYSMYLYNNAFSYMKMGYASAMAWILFVLILFFTIILFKTSKSWVFYQDEG